MFWWFFAVNKQPKKIKIVQTSTICCTVLFMKTIPLTSSTTHTYHSSKERWFTQRFIPWFHIQSLGWFHAWKSHYPFMQYIYFPTVLWAWHICAWYTYCIPPRRGANLSHPIESSSSLSQQNSVFECVVFVWDWNGIASYSATIGTIRRTIHNHNRHPFSNSEHY